MTPIPRSPSLLLPLVGVSVLTISTGFALGFASARRSSGPTPQPAIEASSPRPQGAVRVRLPESLRPHAGVRTEVLALQTLAPTIELAGDVEFDPDRVADIGGRISGRVSQVFVRSGALVRAGDPLLTIVSPSLGELLAASLSARAQLTAARAHAARLSALAAQQLTTAVETDEARARVATLTAELRGIDQRMRAMGGRGASVSASEGLTLRAPISGRVVSRNASVGQVIDPTESVLRVADLSRVLVMLNVFERDLGRVAAGDRVEIRAESLGERVFEGRVAHVDSTVDRDSRTARLHVQVDNADEQLRPGQFVSARLALRGQSSRALAIPRSAVILLEGRPTIFVEVGDGEFEPRPAQLGNGDHERVELVRGAREGERVAVDGVFSLKSELQR